MNLNIFARKTADSLPRILVVDDHHGTRELLKRTLKQLSNAEVHMAPDGETALQLYTALRPQVTLLDIEMPGGISGFDVLAEIRAINADAFVVMVTAHSTIEDVQKAAQLGIGGYIVKPYSARRVADALQRYDARGVGTRMLRDGA